MPELTDVGLTSRKGDEMKQVIAAIVAVMMIVAIPVGIAAVDADADTAEVTGTYSVYAYDGSGWHGQTVEAYDAAQAVQATEMWTSGDSMVPKYTDGTWVTYNYTTYGNITTFMGKTNTDTEQWNIFVMDSGYNLKAADVCLGSYKCFSDYADNYQTANIFLYYGGTATTAASVLSSFYTEYPGTISFSPITQVTEIDDFKVTFTLSIEYEGVNASITGNIYDVNGNLITNESLKTSLVTVIGYGSDCYLALKDALGDDNITGTDAIPGEEYNAYGWMDEMFGLGTVQTDGTDTPNDWTDDSYAYWCIYDGAGSLTDFVLGAYSPLDCAGETFSLDTISLIYDEVTM